MRPIRDKKTGERIGEKPSPARAVTKKELGAAFGRDDERRLVVSLEAEDLITFRPYGTRQIISAPAKDLYRQVIMWQANKAQLERARERKTVKQAQRLARKIKREEKKLTRPL